MPAGNFKDLTGKKFGRLTVIEKKEIKNGKVHWLCICSCGNESVVPTYRLNDGTSKSCGCLKIELQTKHGCGRRNERTPEYKSWYAMIQRCYNENNEAYKDYGGRGIIVCREWLSFENFIKDMGNKPTKSHSIDRLEVNGNYEPQNCKWSDKSEQNRNKRITNPHGVPGVYWDDSRKSFVSRIGLLGKNLFLGRYLTLEEAIKARKAAELKYWGKSS